MGWAILGALLFSQNVINALEIHHVTGNDGHDGHTDWNGLCVPQSQQCMSNIKCCDKLSCQFDGHVYLCLPDVPNVLQENWKFCGQLGWSCHHIDCCDGLSCEYTKDIKAEQKLCTNETAASDAAPPASDAAPPAPAAVYSSYPNMCNKEGWRCSENAPCCDGLECIVKDNDGYCKQPVPEPEPKPKHSNLGQWLNEIETLIEPHSEEFEMLLAVRSSWDDWVNGNGDKNGGGGGGGHPWDDWMNGKGSKNGSEGSDGGGHGQGGGGHCGQLSWPCYDIECCEGLVCKSKEDGFQKLNICSKKPEEESPKKTNSLKAGYCGKEDWRCDSGAPCCAGLVCKMEHNDGVCREAPKFNWMQWVQDLNEPLEKKKKKKDKKNPWDEWVNGKDGKNPWDKYTNGNNSKTLLIKENDYCGKVNEPCFARRCCDGLFCKTMQQGYNEQKTCVSLGPVLAEMLATDGDKKMPFDDTNGKDGKNSWDDWMNNKDGKNSWDDWMNGNKTTVLTKNLTYCGKSNEECFARLCCDGLECITKEHGHNVVKVCGEKGSVPSIPPIPPPQPPRTMLTANSDSSNSTCIEISKPCKNVTGSCCSGLTCAWTEHGTKMVCRPKPNLQQGACSSKSYPCNSIIQCCGDLQCRSDDSSVFGATCQDKVGETTNLLLKQQPVCLAKGYACNYATVCCDGLECKDDSTSVFGKTCQDAGAPVALEALPNEMCLAKGYACDGSSTCCDGLTCQQGSGLLGRTCQAADVFQNQESENPMGYCQGKGYGCSSTIPCCDNLECTVDTNNVYGATCQDKASYLQFLKKKTDEDDDEEVAKASTYRPCLGHGYACNFGDVCCEGMVCEKDAGFLGYTCRKKNLIKASAICVGQGYGCSSANQCCDGLVCRENPSSVFGSTCENKVTVELEEKQNYKCIPTGKECQVYHNDGDRCCDGLTCTQYQNNMYCMRTKVTEPKKEQPNYLCSKENWTCHPDFHKCCDDLTCEKQENKNGTNEFACKKKAMRRNGNRSSMKGSKLFELLYLRKRG